MATKSDILGCLTKAYLDDIAKDYDIAGAYKINRNFLISILTRKRSVKIQEILNGLSLEDLKNVCRGVGVDDTGREKVILIDRILGGDKKEKHKAQSKTNTKQKATMTKKESNGSKGSNAASNETNNKELGKNKNMNNFQDKANFIWQVADDILRGAFKQHEYGDVILPFVTLRRLDCVFEDRKDDVIETYKKFKKVLPDPTQVLLKATNGLNFYNTSYYDLRRLTQDAGNIEINFNNYINGYSKNVREIIDNFQLDKIITKLLKNDLLFLMVDKFTEINLHPDLVTNHEMGYIFEELLRRFSEMSNETAGEHYTPREVIRLMVNLLFEEHQEDLKGKGIIRTVFDPACGTGGMLTIAKDHIQKNINPDIELIMYGQELNEQTYAISKSDVLIIGEEADNIRLGTSFSRDKFKGNKFDFMLSNPPFGVSWKKEQPFIKNEANDPYGRFHAGLPRVSDGALLFLQHMISKMEPTGSRIAIIFNGSPLFTGDAGSGESDLFVKALSAGFFINRLLGCCISKSFRLIFFTITSYILELLSNVVYGIRRRSVFQ